MTQIACRLSLILYCFCAAFFVNTDASFVMAFFLSIFLSCSSFYFHSKKYSFVICTLFLTGGLIFPALLLFLPPVIFEVVFSSDYPLLLIAAAGLLRLYSLFPLELFFFMAAGILLSALLAYQAQTHDALVREYQKSRDDSTELTLLLRDRNKTLLEKQNYEIYTATLKERNRIAREIHDNVGHMLSRSILMIGAMKTILKDDQLKVPLTQLDHTLNEAMDSVRKSVHDLHDDSVDLKDATESLIASFDFCKVALTYDMSLNVPREIKYSFISITKEALSNIMKHSNATSALITMREHPGLYQLIIKDNGTRQASGKDTGIGLVNMKDRISTLNGTIQFQTDEGFRIFITVPKNHHAMKERQ